jgi:hypothetical protein
MKKTIYMRRRHNGIGVSQISDYSLGSLSWAYGVCVHLEVNEKHTDAQGSRPTPAAVKDRPYTLMLFPAEAEQLAQQLLEQAAKARAHQEGRAGQ